MMNRSVPTPIRQASRGARRFAVLWLLPVLMLLPGCEDPGAGDNGQDPLDAVIAPVEVTLGDWDPASNDHLEWRFLPAELDHISRGRFWSAGWENGNRHGTNPIAVITAYHEALGELGVKLLVVPVPPKAAVYPDLTPEETPMPEAIDEFYDLLRANGVNVVDLLPGLQVERVESLYQLYCKTDTHWSPTTGALAARTVAAMLTDEPWAAERADAERFQVQPLSVLAFHGDLLEDDEKTSEMLERLPLEQVLDRDAPGAGVAADASSPVLVIGDSHAMVFSTGGDMHARAAGFVDHLQAALGFPVDLSANRGSGIDAARGSVTRRAVQEPGFWDDKKVVIWLFTGREFTQGRWVEIPPVVN